MRLLLAEDEQALSKALTTILSMRHTMEKRHWSI